MNLMEQGVNTLEYFLKIQRNDSEAMVRGTQLQGNYGSPSLTEQRQMADGSPGFMGMPSALFDGAT
ncbi:MAG: hypothetical protein RIM23_20825 [Coleofasciculus sp. G3-WIS-01]|uniref:hypothetical protein n=1 Tax=Coleofasciculus sp. G3-WIS-01 TaxID=3069528 RepID=UPI0032F5B2B5